MPDKQEQYSAVQDPRAQRRSIMLLAGGHLCADIAQGALPALLPFLIAARGLKFAQAGGLMFAMSAGSSVIQPVFGYYADRLSKSWLMSAGLLLAGLGISMAGVASSYWTIVLAVAVCGLGIAAFHPEAARLANSTAGANKATAMSIFSFGGNTGFACGPLLAAGIHMLLGLRGTLILAVPPLVMSIILLTQRDRFASPPPSPTDTAEHAKTAPPADAWGSFCWLSIAVLLRSIIFYGLITFLPLFWIHVLGQSKEAGSSMLTVLFATGAVGTLLGGRLADRFGNRRVMRTGFVLLFPVLLLWLHTRSVAMAAAMLVPLALIYYAPFSAIVVLGQQYLPNRVGFASGVTLGLAVSVGGVVAPLLGRWADLHGVLSALMWVTVLPVLCAVISFALPPAKKRSE